MNIAIYVEGLKVFTSGMPGRGMIYHLIKLRKNDSFILIIRSGSESDPILQSFIGGLKDFENWKLHIEKTSRRVVNIKNLLRIEDYNKVNVDADVYLSMDVDPLGNKSPMICTLADLSTVNSPKKSSLNKIGRKIRKFGFEQMVKKADKIVCISNFTKNDLLNWKSVSQNKVEVIYNGIQNQWLNNQIFSLKSEDKFKMPYWIWWGYLSPRKNIIGLIEAYSLYVKKCQVNKIIYLCLVVSGSKKSIADIKSLIKSKNLSDFVHIKAQKSMEDLITLVDYSSGVVFPSFYEGFGLPVVEALARGKHVACSDLDVLKEISGEYAIYFNPYDITSIKEGLLKLASKENLHDAQIFKNWAKQFTYNSAAKKYSKLIDCSV